MTRSKSERGSAVACTLLVFPAFLASVTGCVGTGSPDGELVECDGPCDAFGGVSLLVCEERAVANGEPGCAAASARDIGVHPTIPEVAVPFYVVVRGLSVVQGVSLSLRVYDENEVAVRTIAIANVTDGGMLIEWDGHDDAGDDVVAPFHTVRLEATAGTSTARSGGHVIATLLSLPDEGTGYYHHLGTDRIDTDDWGRVHVIEALQTIGREWSHRNRIGYLDLSLHNGGEFSPHTYHRHGECLDLRYVRTDAEGALDLRWDSSVYDREATQRLIDALFDHGAIEVFTDSRAGLAGEDVIVVGGHTNHLHVFFGLTPDDADDDRPVNHRFVGGPCADDSDCPLRDGLCLLSEGQEVGVCTRECDAPCSDYVGGIYTLSECVTVDAQRYCMPARDLERYPGSGCRSDLVARSLPSLDRNNAATDVCVPE